MKMGVTKARLISADVQNTLDLISKSGIILHNLRIKDEIYAEFRVEKSSLRILNRIVQHQGDRIEIISHEGIYWGIRHLIRRPVMLFGVLFLLFLTIYLPTRVLFIRVEGNLTIPTQRILEAAGECGIGFGAKTREVRSEKMKNALLHQIPTLQWAGINTDGCVAVISVREKTIQEKKEYAYPITSMVATRDGYITELTVTAGSAACKVGQSVEKGQILISAYSDCGSHIMASRAEGEVYADTNRRLSSVMLQKHLVKTREQKTERQFSVLFGKKLIKLSKGSGISGSECDRIKSVYYMTLPGGFRLPLAFIIETVTSYETVSTKTDKTAASKILASTMERCLLDTMVAGKINHTVTNCQTQRETYTMTGEYECNEMICQIRTEEILDTNERNGTNYQRGTG